MPNFIITELVESTDGRSTRKGVVTVVGDTHQNKDDYFSLQLRLSATSERFPIVKSSRGFYTFDGKDSA
jgi:hypothetical protein